MSLKDAPKSEIDSIITLFSNNNLQEALKASLFLIEEFPSDPLLLNILGACHAGLEDLHSAVKNYKKAIAIKSDYAKAHYNLGVAFHELGQLDESIISYETSLSIDPNYAEAHLNLGNVYKDNGQFDNAIESYNNAIIIKPDYIEAHFSLSMVSQELGEFNDMIAHSKKVLEINPNLDMVHNTIGFGFKELGQLDAAISSYQDALSINPNNSEAHNNLGNIFEELGKTNQALKAYKDAIKISPDFPTLHNNLGNAFKSLGQLKDALISYENALKHNPDYAEAHNSIGLIFFEQKHYDKAIKSYQKAINFDQNFANAHNNLGVVFNKIGQYDDAIQSYKNALSIRTDYADALNNLGVAYKKLGQFDNSIISYEAALDINYDDADAHNNLGIVFFELERFDDSINSYNNAIKINPKMADAYNNLGHVLSGINQYNEAINAYEKGFNINPNLDFILGNILSSKMNSCNWNNLSSLQSNIIESLGADNKKIIDPFSFMGLIDNPELQRKATEIRVLSDHPKSNVLPKILKYSKHQKIRVGYFSGDFREHPVGYLTAGLYEAHNRDHFEIHAFSLGPDTNDEMNLRIKAGVDHFHDVGSMPHKDIALLARSLEIDIAVDLAGLTAKSKTDVFAMSAAPIQLSYIGYLGTMGVNYYDYLIADQIMIPKKYQKHYVEKIVYLPSFQVNDSKDLPPDITLMRKEMGLPKEGFVFCCFNNTYKILPATFDSWARILKQVDGSVLIVYANQELIKTNLIKEIIDRGVDPKRLIFGESLARAEYLARYKVADLFLDTHPYNAGTTASDALRMGLPLLTLIGKSYQSRMGASILNAINLPELIASSEEEYESFAIEIATNPEKHKKIKNKLESNLTKAPLFNTKLFTKNIETAYKEMYERYDKGLEPDHIYVE